jgi:hypothetical protein
MDLQVVSFIWDIRSLWCSYSFYSQVSYFTQKQNCLLHYYLEYCISGYFRVGTIFATFAFKTDTRKVFRFKIDRDNTIVSRDTRE